MNISPSVFAADMVEVARCELGTRPTSFLRLTFETVSSVGVRVSLNLLILT